MMIDLFDQQTTRVNVHHTHPVELEKNFQLPFPTVFTDVYVFIPEAVLCPRVADRHYQVEAIWETHQQVLREPKSNEAANCWLKPNVSGKISNLLSFTAINDYLWTHFAKRSLAMPVIDNALVLDHKDRYHLAVKIMDPYQSQVSLEQIAKALLDQHTKLSWPRVCQRVRQDLSQVERFKFLQQLLYRVVIDCEINPAQFVFFTQYRRAKLAPFSGVIPKRAYDPIYEPNPQHQEWVTELVEKTPARTPEEFWQLVAVMEVNLAMFKKAARELLGQWTYVWPDYLDQLQPLIPGLRFKKNLVPQGGSHTQTWLEYLKHQHQQRVTDLEAQGWYADLNLPAPIAGYPFSQPALFGLPTQSGPNRPRHKRHRQRCEKTAAKPALPSQLQLFK